MNDIDILKSMLSGEKLKDALELYNNGTPAAYILGEWEFCGDRYIINQDCLIPRCDTERVLECLLENLSENGTFADICTGSGCIAISALKRRKNATAFCIDISQNAIEAALQNATINGVENRAEFICEDIFNYCFTDKKFDIIVSNPPYIPTKDLDILDKYVKKEPIRALDGGSEGMDFYDNILSKHSHILKENGKIIFEIGYDQKEKIIHLAAQYGFKCQVILDYSGNPRVAILQK